MTPIKWNVYGYWRKLIGLIIWNFFVGSTAGTIQILQVKKYLYEYSNMNKMEIYVSSAIAWTSSENTVGERLL